MEAVFSSKASSVNSSPFSSPNIGALLKIRVISWSHETGLPVTIRVRVGEKMFNLHKNRLFSKSGYFKRKLNDSTITELELPENFPGGPETFETLALFLYSSSTMIVINPFNVASLRCGAEFLEMTEQHSQGNLCERLDLYLNQIVFQSWDDTLIVLQKCQALLPWSEELLIIGRCIESLAFMVCMEILDDDRPFHEWSSERMKDLVALPFGFFKRVILSLRRQGMRERYISPMLVFYATKWVISEKTRQFCESLGEENDGALTMLRGVLDLLPLRDKGSKIIPVGFYFSLLSRSVELGLEDDRRAELSDKILSVLHYTKIEDFNFGTLKVEVLETIFSRYVQSNSKLGPNVPEKNAIISELWDSYLSHVALDSEMGSKRFMELIEVVPICYRQSHDHLYKAMSSYLQAHPNISQEEKGLVCKYLNCRKLSQATSIEVVQNEFMPLRLIVQALFVQQLDTHQALKDCSLGSFSCPNSGESTRSFTKTPFSDRTLEPKSRPPLSFLLHKEVEESQKPEIAEKEHELKLEISEKEYELTSFRIQSLEKEIVSLKRSLQKQNVTKKSDPGSEKSNCIGSLTFTLQRKCANKMLKIFSGLTLFRSNKTKQKPL